eukprot:765118-Hanusia_phi.AAC.4
MSGLRSPVLAISQMFAKCSRPSDLLPGSNGGCWMFQSWHAHVSWDVCSFKIVVHDVHKKTRREQEQSRLRILHTTTSQTTAVRYRTFSRKFPTHVLRRIAV